MNFTEREVQKASVAVATGKVNYDENTSPLHMAGYAVGTIDAVVRKVLPHASQRFRGSLHKDAVAFVAEGMNYAPQGGERKLAEEIMSMVVAADPIVLLDMIGRTYASDDLFEHAKSIESITRGIKGQPLQRHGYRDDPCCARDFYEHIREDNNIEARFDF